MDTFDHTGFETLKAISKADQFNGWMFKAIQTYLNGNILEIGSGIGNISRFCISNGFTISLSDVDNNYLSILYNRFNKLENVKGFFAVDLQHDRFEQEYISLKEKFDTILFLNVLEHLKNDSEAIANCRFLLKKGGVLITLTPAYSILYSGMDKALGHYRRYTLDSLKKLMTTHNLALKKAFYFNALGIGAWLYGKLFSIKKISGQEMTFYNKLVPLAKKIDLLTFHKIGLSAIIIVQK